MVMQTEEIGGGRSTRRAFMSRSAGTLAAVGGAGGLLAACGSPAAQKGAATNAASSGTVQVVNILPPQLGYAAEYIADMDGFFKKEGLTVKANTARGSAPAIQAILSGTALLSWVGWLESVIDIANKNAPLQSVAFTGRRSTLAIVSDKAKKPLQNPKDLVGNRIGMSACRRARTDHHGAFRDSHDEELRDGARRATPSALTKSRRKGDGSLTTSCGAFTKVLSLIQTLTTDAFTRLRYLDASADKA